MEAQEDAWVISIHKKVWGSDSGCRTFDHCARFEQQPTIFRVPDNIRSCDREAYEPLVVVLGPYRNAVYRCPATIRAMQDQKWLSVRFLLARLRHPGRARAALDGCLAAIKDLEIRARRCYVCDTSLLSLPSDEFVEMLLLDSCFILDFLLRNHERRRKTTISSDDEEEGGEKGSVGDLWTWSFVKYDLLKLENQIPFFVIETVFDLVKTAREEDTDPILLAEDLFQLFHPRRNGPMGRPKEAHHLLHLYHHSLLPEKKKKKKKKKKGEGAGLSPAWIPSATELEESGIRFRRKEDGYSCLDVSFVGGVVEMPTLQLCKYSSTVFRNLMALEQGFPVGAYVTNYAMFMDCVLHGGQRDMRLLHLKGIVRNRWSRDEEVAGFFNDLSKEIHYGYGSNYLSDVFEEVTRYSESRWNRWRASLVREYFSSPWVIISVAAAVFLILMTMQQAFFSAYSYFLPPR